MLGALLAVGIPLAFFSAGYLAGFDTVADSVAVERVAMLAGAPQPAVATIYPKDDAIDLDPAEAAPQPVVREVAVESGDNLMAILTRVGVDPGQAHAAITALRKVYNPRRDLNVGDLLQLTLWPGRAEASPALADAEKAEGLALDGMVLPVSYDRDVAVTRDPDGGYSASEVERPLERAPVRAEGTINSSLFVDARDAGVPIDVLIELIRIYSFDVDFQREIQPGDRFEVMFEQFRDEAGKPVHNGEVAYARLTLSGTEVPLYRYETSDGTLDWFNAKGESLRKALMRTPIDGARLSSGFGMRKHPILGYSKLHSGTDFAAPSGTPIYAAGSGVIAEIGNKGGYGKYIRIRHNGTYSTAYAHMKGFARGMTSGRRVQQGQVIGYVGTTGRSTGPHLHYEVHRDGSKINPQSVKLPSGETLKGAELARFAKVRDAAERLFASLAPATLVAGNEADTVACGGGSPKKHTDRGGC